MSRLHWLFPLLVLPAAWGCGGPVGDTAEDLDGEVQQQALLGAELKTTSVFANACGNNATAPQIFSKTLMHPPALLPGGAAPAYWNPAAGRITRGGIHYVSSNGLRFELVTDGCTFIKEVRVGSRIVTSTYTDGFWFSAQASTNPPKDPARKGYNLWVFFPKQPDGSTDTVTITVGRVWGKGTATYSFPMVRVESVEASNVRAPIGISRAELTNMFGKSLYAMFNGATNSAVITSANGSKRRIYGYDPKTLSVSVDAATGVSFSFKFKTDINNWCDPTVRAHGNFNLKADNNGVAIDWINAAQASLDWPTGCAAVQVIPILGMIPYLVYELIEDQAGNSVRASIESAIGSALPDVGAANLFLDGSSTRKNELLVYLKLPVPSVGLRVPYDAFDLARGATAFPSGENLTILANGLGMNDAVAGVSPKTTLWSGPNGVPRHGSTNWPAAQTVSRTSPLVWQGAPVARLLARRTDSMFAGSTTYQYTPGCTVKTHSSFGNASLRFGVNDTAADAQRMRGVLLGAPGYRARVLFLNELGTGIADLAPRCGSTSSVGTVLAP